MKKSIKDILEDTFSDKTKWDYYCINTMVNPFESIEKSKEFIKNFITRSGKAETKYPLHPPHLAYKKIAKHLC